MKNVLKLAGLGGLVAASSAHAAMDTTAIIASVTDAGTAAGVIGAAVLVVIVAIRAYKYLRGAL